jgi:hypothetical protein
MAGWPDVIVAVVACDCKVGFVASDNFQPSEKVT